jgi:RNA polymerase sigma factor (sigma-70 family)
MATQLHTVIRHIRSLVAPPALHQLTDSQLVERFSREHDHAAFAELMKRHGTLVWAVCRRRLQFDQDVEDAFQATFLVLALKAGSIKKRQALASWLHGAAYRSASHIVRQTARRRQHEREAAAMTKSPHQGEIAWRELQTVVDEELQRLPEKYRAPFVLCCLEGKTKAEAARQLGWKEGTVSGRLALARQQLQKRLTRRGVSLSLVLGVSALSETATAHVPGSLVGTTLQAALAAAGRATVTGLVSAEVAAVVNTLTKATISCKLKLAAFIFLSAGLVSAGAEVISRQLTGDRPEASPVAPEQNRSLTVAAQKAPTEAKIPNPALARVAGQVVDEKGLAVADAIISTLELGVTMKRPTTKSAADGSFLLQLDQPAARYVTLLATADRGAQQGLFELADSGTPLGNSAQARIVMKPSRTIRVRVTDGQGKGVESAAVEVSNTYIPLAGAVTDADGRAALRVPADAHVYWVVGLKPGAGFDYFENYRSWGGYISEPPPTDVSLVLEGARTVRIQATDSKNKPVPGVGFVPWLLAKNGKLADVNLSGYGPLTTFTAKTDRQGIATFDWIPKNLKGGIHFNCASKSYFLTQFVLFDPLHAQGVLPASLLKAGPIRGKVRFPNGKPAAGILLQAEGSRSRLLARSGADGSYAFETNPQSPYIIAVTDDNWAAPSHHGFPMEEGKTLENLDFRLERGTLIQGKVTVGRDGKPAPDQTVTLTDNTSSLLVRWANTDKKGHYQFRVGPGYYEIWAPGTKHDGIAVQKQDTIPMDFHLERLERGPLLGTVRAGAEEKPVARAIIQGESIGQQGHAGFKVIADFRGRFQTDRWRDRMHLYATDPEGDLAAFLTIGEEDENIDIVLVSAGKVKGRLVDSQSKPRQGIRVVGGMTMGPKNAPEGRGTAEALTDKEGRFTLGGLLVGARCLVHADLGGNVQIKELQINDTQTIDLGDLAVEVP